MAFGLLNKITTWDEAAARHILSRTLYGYTKQELQFTLSVSLDEFVDNNLLANSSAPTPPGEWITYNPDPNDPQNGTRMNELSHWWLKLMLTQGILFREKMVLFLHNHFVSEKAKVYYPQYMYIQNALLRQHCFGNFKQLVKEITIDPAMLIYLDGIKNSKNSPNENYSRELLELFTIGIGNYTENDIKQGARALTGWRVNGLTSYFTSSLFDNGTKTYLGQTGNFNQNDIVDIIFTKDETAKFICRKLYKEFVFYQPNETYVTELANVFKANNFEIKPVLSAMLKSVYFHSTDIRGARIKAPVDVIISSLKQFNISTPDYTYLRQTSESLQQIILDPPDVRGWEGQRKWISTTTFPTRNQFTDSIVNGKKPNGTNLSFKIDAVPFARTFPSSENAQQFVEDVCKFLFQYPVSESRKAFLLEVMLDGIAPQNWSTYDPQADSRLRKFYKALMRLPDFQLS